MLVVGIVGGCGWLRGDMEWMDGWIDRPHQPINHPHQTQIISPAGAGAGAGAEAGAEAGAGAAAAAVAAAAVAAVSWAGAGAGAGAGDGAAGKATSAGRFLRWVVGDWVEGVGWVRKMAMHGRSAPIHVSIPTPPRTTELLPITKNN